VTAGNRRGFSLPYVPIVVVLVVVAFLVIRYHWWWLGVAVGLVFAAFIVSATVNSRRGAPRNAYSDALMGPLYGLYHVRTIEESAAGGYSYDIVPTFWERYNLEEQRTIIGAMRRALVDPDIDFSEVLPNLRFTNDEIRQHLKVTLKRLLPEEEETP
jgi:hypothetical protein